MIEIAFVGQLVMAIIGFAIGALFLKLTLKMFKIKTNWEKVLKVAGISAVVSFVLGFIDSVVGGLLSLVVTIYFIKTFYKLKWGKSILVWLVWAVITFVAVFLVTSLLVLAGLAGVLGLASLMG